MDTRTDRYVAFLRGMNLGRRRITNEDLRAHIRALGFSNVSAFLASGNVVFDSGDKDSEAVALAVETGLSAALDYQVPTFVRRGAEVRAVANYAAFPDRDMADSKVHVALLKAKPSASSRQTVLDLSTADDSLVLDGRELYWRRRGNFLDSALDLDAIERLVGPMTVRTHRTIERLAAKFLGQ